VKRSLIFSLFKTRKAGLFLATLVILGAGAVTYLLLQKSVSTTALKTNSSSLLSREELERLNKDSDSDGLRDWEETIYGTVPENPDTDGDGTKDGEEIKQNRDPLKPSPDDLLAAPAKTPDESSPYLQANNLTGQLAEKFGINVIIPRLSGSQRPLDLDFLGEVIAEETLRTSPYAVYFTEKDIRVSKDNGVKAFESYSLAMVESDTAFVGIGRSPLEIFADALQRDDFSSLGLLDTYLVAYDKKIERLKNISTPSQLTSFHIKNMNLIASQKNAVQKIRNAESDIVSAVVGSQEFVSNFQQFQSLMQSLSYVPTK
jgi:hypothetical protein